MRWAPLALLCACAAQEPRGPYFGDERHLVLGVDPEREAALVVERMTTAGYTLALRLRGIRYTALEFADAGGRPVAVRVVTSRGIALALDAREGDALRPALAWRLLPVRLPALRDVDAAEQVFVEERVTGAVRCVRAYAVDAAGVVRESDDDVDPRIGPGCVAREAPPDAGLR